MSRIKNQILSKLKEYASKMGTNTMGGDDYTSKKKGGLRDFDGYDNVDYNKDMPMDEATKGDVMRAVKGKPNPYSLVVIKRGKVIYQKDIKNPQDAPAIYSVIRKHMDKGERIHIEDRTGKVVFKEGINEACWKGYKEVGGKIKNGKQVPNCVPESIDEGMMSTIDQIRKDSKDVRDFVKKVFSDRDFKDMKNDKDFVKYLKSIYESVNEDGHPQNWMSGRTSDYHTALRGKKKDYSGGTNFKKKNHGQPDIEDEIEEGFDKLEHLKLLNNALKAMPGSPKQKEIIRKLNKVRKAGGMRPLKERTKTDFNSKGYKEASKLVAKLRSTTFKKFNDDELEQFRAALAFSFDLKEYASKLTLSYIADKDSKLDGTPEDIKAIDEKAERDYKAEYKKFQSSTKAKKYRAELNKYNRQKGTYGNGDGKDASHKGGKIVGFESASKNRGRKEKSRLKKK